MRSVSMSRGAWLLVMVGCAPAVHAASLQISPVMVTFTASANATGITLRNTGDKPLYGQVRVFAWDQSSGKDQLVPTQELLASPPLLQIDTQGQQLVRLVRASLGPVPAEKSYRLLIDELPNGDTPSGNSVLIRLRYSVPVFIAPDHGLPKPQLSWHLAHGATGAWALSATNHGTLHAQIAAVTLTDAAGHSYSLVPGLLGYVLAGQSNNWDLKLPADAKLSSPLTLHARINTHPTDIPIMVE